jgi:hypothetical protein
MELGLVKPLRVRAASMGSDKPKEENGWSLSLVIHSLFILEGVLYPEDYSWVTHVKKREAQQILPLFIIPNIPLLGVRVKAAG